MARVTHGLRLFTKLLVAHPLVGVCLPAEIRPVDYLSLTGYMVGSLFIRDHSAGSYAGMVWETILRYLGSAQHSYSHWTRVVLSEGRPDMAQLEGIPGVLPFEVYSQAPLRLISWCSFELPKIAKRLLCELAIMCELPETTTQALVNHIAVHNSAVQTEQEATQYLVSVATVTLRQGPNCSPVPPWFNISSAPCNCPWLSTC